ncbi:MAG: ATP-binding protein [Eggerthellaceae bacterium]
MEYRYIDVLPDASRIMEGLRDTGYDFNTAIADIVDNSIAAEATKVCIKVDHLFSGEVKVSIADDGIGMTQDELIQAMRYGAPERTDKHSLGKFGLGLKTASTSCCRRLKVVSRKPAGSKNENCAVWDLDHIATRTDGNWSLMLCEPDDGDIETLNDCAGLGTGTVVLWEKCDRILSRKYRNPNSAAYRSAIERITEALRFHLSLTFERFLNHSDSRARNVDIFLNGVLVKPWDPFCKELHDDYGSDVFEINHDSAVSRISVSAYIVPQKEEFESLEEKQRIMPTYKNDALRNMTEESLSGFYVYRENRLIHWGDWFGMPGVDFHNKFCRFELSFDSDLDDDFQVDVKKSRIILDEEIKKQLVKFANPFKLEGARQYRTKQTKKTKEKASNVHSEANTVIASAESTLVNPDSVVAISATEAEISNKFGVTVVPYNIHENSTGENIHIEAVEELQENLLWMPALIGKKRAVQLNANHEFYKRFYTNNKDNPAAILAMDYVFYALAQAENEALGEEARDNLEDARYEASKQLRKLAKFLPDTSIEDLDEGDE